MRLIPLPKSLHIESGWSLYPREVALRMPKQQWPVLSTIAELLGPLAVGHGDADFEVSDKIAAPGTWFVGLDYGRGKHGAVRVDVELREQVWIGIDRLRLTVILEGRHE